MTTRPPRSTLFPCTTLFRSYDDGLRHANFAGTYPRQKNTGGVGVVPARTECDCHYGAEFSAVGESLIDRKSTRLNSSHMSISSAVFCLKKKKTKHMTERCKK